MVTPELLTDLKVFSHLIYEYEKGVRNLLLYTISAELLPLATQKLDNRAIEYIVKPVPNNGCMNIFFGRKECLQTLRQFLGERSLNTLSPEEDFILGALLGYDLCRQCERYCQRVEHSKKVEMPHATVRQYPKVLPIPEEMPHPLASALV